MAATRTLRCDPAPILPLLDELTALVSRRGSLPEFRHRLFEIRDALGGALEARWVDGELGAAGAGDCFLRLQFGQAFLDRLAALRAFDRDFDAHGASA
jgi:hypothetical protein